MSVDTGPRQASSEIIMKWDDLSSLTKTWMKLLGNFGPTVKASQKQLKGYMCDDNGESVKTYLDAGELRELAKACTDAADWLEARANEAAD